MAFMKVDIRHKATAIEAFAREIERNTELFPDSILENCRLIRSAVDAIEQEARARATPKRPGGPT